MPTRQTREGHLRVSGARAGAAATERTKRTCYNRHRAARRNSRIARKVLEFTGHPLDGATNGTGLQNNLHRWYDSSVGKWLSEDPIGYLTDMSLSRYCGNSPTSYSDPSGLKKFSDTSNQEKSSKYDALSEAMLRGAIDPRFPGVQAWMKKMGDECKQKYGAKCCLGRVYFAVTETEAFGGIYLVEPGVSAKFAMTQKGGAPTPLLKGQSIPFVSDEIGDRLIVAHFKFKGLYLFECKVEEAGGSTTAHVHTSPMIELDTGTMKGGGIGHVVASQAELSRVKAILMSQVEKLKASLEAKNKNAPDYAGIDCIVSDVSESGKMNPIPGVLPYLDWRKKSDGKKIAPDAEIVNKMLTKYPSLFSSWEQ
jgi:RHS repeat-associated protein